jgi:hypothetical protein
MGLLHSILCICFLSYLEWTNLTIQCVVAIYLETGFLHITCGAFTLDVKLVLNENLGAVLGGTQC